MKIYIIPIIVMLGMLFASCESDYLDKMAESDGYDDAAVFQDSVNFKNFNDKLIVTPLLKRHRNDTRPLGDFDDVSDNSISGADWTGVPSVLAATGDFYSMRTADPAVMANNGTWSRIWSLVRVANVCIKNIDQYPGSVKSRNRILGTSYFFRGYCYFELTRRWGGMPYFYKPIGADENMDVPRLSYQETMLLAAADLDSAAMYLEPVIAESDWGRPTQVAALAFKAKALVYAASEFATMQPGARNDLWDDAALAADEAIRLAEANDYGLAPIDKYYYIFKENEEEVYTKEILYGRRYDHTWGSNSYKQRYRPPGQLSGQYATAPNQTLVDCFEMQATGLPVSDPASGYNPQDPYAGRDPRFAESIIRNQQVVMGRTMQIFDKDETKTPATFGSTDLVYTAGQVSMGYTKTGYYNNKWMGRTFNANLDMHYPEIRMSEVYLLFAEAANEAWASPTQRNTACKYSAEEAVNIVRTRAQMPDVASKFLNKDDFRERVRNERRVELCFEDNRLFDIRRWYIAHLPENRDIWKMEIAKVAKDATHPTGFRYTPRLYKQRVFEERHYLFVIKLDDTNIGPNFKQNPGW
ncbi:RagB/SusD family nutrient uptake outer membrane protein [Gaoshiqia sp. Z1-71]|uniref:RagB/SusD family nutrient uptake outer membrane protein n=1 Tax=Gaoshiqia hydrogeniformans TaxID=3290090 RepID=UPI003BF7F07A